MADSDDFVVQAPMWIVAARPGPRPGDRATRPVQTPALTGYAVVTADGHPCVAVFTGRDLANRWVEHAKRLKTMAPSVIDTPQQWIDLLKWWAQNGETRIAFDPNPEGRPSRVFLIQDVLNATVKTYGGG